MKWIGKIVGGLLGLAMTRGLLGAALGVLLGHQFDRGLGAPRVRARRSEGLSDGARQQAFFETTFLVMGHLAKADGRVSEEEIRAARAVMHRMRLRPEAVRLAIDLFNRGKQPGFDLEHQVGQLRQAIGQHADLGRAFLEIQMSLALSKGAVQPGEREVLWQIARALGFGRVELAQMEAILRAQRTFGQGQAQARRETALDQAYKALGVEPAASDRDIKLAYRRLMNEHHPDKLLARGLPESMLEVAKERTREIRAAYELLREHRGIK